MARSITITIIYTVQINPERKIKYEGEIREIGEDNLWVQQLTYNPRQSTKLEPKDTPTNRILHDDRMMADVRDMGEEQFSLHHNTNQLRSLLEHMQELKIEYKTEVDPQHKELLTAEHKNCTVIKKQLIGWFKKYEYHSELQDILVEYAPTIQYKPKGSSPLTIKRYEAVYNRYYHSRNEDDNKLTNEQFIEKLSSEDFLGKTYAKATIKDIIYRKEKRLKKPKK